MQPYEILITKTIYDDDGGEEKSEVIFGPEVIFAYAKSDAVKKAVIESKITSTDVNDVDFYVREFVTEGEKS